MGLENLTVITCVKMKASNSSHGSVFMAKIVQCVYTYVFIHMCMLGCLNAKKHTTNMDLYQLQGRIQDLEQGVLNSMLTINTCTSTKCKIFQF